MLTDGTDPGNRVEPIPRSILTAQSDTRFSLMLRNSMLTRYDNPLVRALFPPVPRNIPEPLHIEWNEIVLDPGMSDILSPRPRYLHREKHQKLFIQNFDHIHAVRLNGFKKRVIDYLYSPCGPLGRKTIQSLYSRTNYSHC